MLGSDRQYEGATKPTSIEKDMYEPALFAGRFTEIPNNMQIMSDYVSRTDSQPIYLGYAPKGLATDVDGWILYKFTYDVSDRITVRQTQYSNWDARTSGTYE